MKNFVITFLIVLVAVLGFLLFIRSNNDVSDNTDSTASMNENESAPKSSSGQTIDLANKNLDDIPKDILDDKTVTTLNVSGNNLTGALPAEIRKLTNLEVLNASNNKMTGVPAEIGQLSKLTTVNFANNNLSGLPLEIGNLKNLETLDLRGNPDISKLDIGKIQPLIPNATILTD